jgi:hypothetical protein
MMRDPITPEAAPMRIHLGAGSIADRLNAVAMTLQECKNLPVVAWKWGRIVRALELIAHRATVIRHRGGSLANVAGLLDWLNEVVRYHPALQESEGAALRDELLGLIRRIGRTRGHG